MVALHGSVPFRDRDHRERGRSAAIRADEATGVGQHQQGFPRVVPRPEGVGDAGRSHRRRLRASGQLDARLRGEGGQGRIEQVEVDGLDGRTLVGEPRGFVLAGGARQVDRGFHEGAYGGAGEIARVHVGGAVAHEDAEAQPAAARVGEGLHLSLAERDREVRALEQEHVGVVGSRALGLGEHVRGEGQEIHGGALCHETFGPGLFRLAARPPPMEPA